MNEKATLHGKADVEKFEERGPDETASHALVDSSPAALMQIALSKGMDLDKLEKMLELQERFEAVQAKKAFVFAMSEFKKKPLEILKDKSVSFITKKGTPSEGKTEYDHASLANVVNVIGAELANHGLSAAWKTDQGDFGIKVTCILFHSGGHSEEVSLTAPPDLSGGKNPIQALASTVSYLERYTLLAITGLTTKDMDTNGIQPKGEIEYITTDMQTEINDFIKATKTNKAKFLKYIKAESIEKIPLSEYGKVIVAFQAKEDAQIQSEKESEKSKKEPEQEPKQDELK